VLAAFRRPSCWVTCSPPFGGRAACRPNQRARTRRLFAPFGVPSDPEADRNVGPLRRFQPHLPPRSPGWPRTTPPLV